MRGFEVAETILSALSHLDAPSFTNRASPSSAVIAASMLARAAKRALMLAYEDVKGDTEICRLLADASSLLKGYTFSKHEVDGLYEVLCIYPSLSRVDAAIAAELARSGSLELDLSELG